MQIEVMSFENRSISSCSLTMYVCSPFCPLYPQLTESSSPIQFTSQGQCTSWLFGSLPLGSHRNAFWIFCWGEILSSRKGLLSSSLPGAHGAAAFSYALSLWQGLLLPLLMCQENIVLQHRNGDFLLCSSHLCPHGTELSPASLQGHSGSLS